MKMLNRKSLKFVLAAAAGGATLAISLFFSRHSEQGTNHLALEVGEAQAKSFADASKENEAECNAWCTAHEGDGCSKCSTLRGCGLGLKNMKTFGGRGKNWHACEDTDWVKNSEKNSADCQTYCESSVDCAFCSVKPGGGLGYKHLKTFGGKGKNWYAVEHRDGKLGSLAVSEVDTCCGQVKKPLDCSNPFWTGAITATFVPHWNRVFHDACVRHDFCYIYGKTTYGKTQAQCDLALRADTRLICERDIPDPVSKLICLKNAEIYYQGVSKLGESYFASDGQHKCQYPDRMTSRSERQKLGACAK